MFFNQLYSFKPEDIPEEQTEQFNVWVEPNVATEIWTTAVISTKFGISGARLNQLHKSHHIPGHFKLGSTHLYLARFAEPWFVAYKSRKKVKKVKIEVKDKKVKGQYEYELFGQAYKSTNPPAEERANWRGYVASQWPEYFVDASGERAHAHIVTNRDAHQEYFDLVLPKLAEIDKVFRKLISEHS